MLIESHERGYVAKLLVVEGRSAPVDSCIAVLVDDAADVPAFAGHTPPYPSANSGAGPGRMFCWQAYLKT
jgi:pyruvate/2-oxoglutarate dehydrogenase complex dihydrolipoamide acyltransferase (E2) component